jgi:hypothetical protein
MVPTNLHQQRGDAIEVDRTVIQKNYNFNFMLMDSLSHEEAWREVKSETYQILVVFGKQIQVK